MLCVFTTLSTLRSSSLIANAPRDQDALTIFGFNHEFCMLFHASALVQMCIASRIVGEGPPCEINTNGTQIYSIASADGAKVSDMFAAPLVFYKGQHVSQSVAATAFAGEALGFGKAIPPGGTPKAIQYMLDLRDFVDQIAGTPPWVTFDQVVESGRLDKWMGNFERSIVGPFFYGKERTYVDYYFVSMFRWVRYKLATHDPPSDFPAYRLMMKYPKVKRQLLVMGTILCVPGSESVTCQEHRAEVWTALPGTTISDGHLLGGDHQDRQ